MKIRIANLALCLAVLLPISVTHSQQNVEDGITNRPKEPAATVDFPRAISRQADQQQTQILDAIRSAQQGRRLPSPRRGFAAPTQSTFEQSPFEQSQFEQPVVRRNAVSPALMRANQEAEIAISNLVQQIRRSDDSSVKENLKSEIEELLSTQYDAYLEHHEQPLIQLEEKLQKLRDEFESRKQAKDDLVKLRLDTIWYEAIGLNWPATNGGFVRPQSQLNPSPLQNFVPDSDIRRQRNALFQNMVPDASYREVQRGNQIFRERNVGQKDFLDSVVQQNRLGTTSEEEPDE